ncbi:hypothetical protein J6590_019861 [Homalodisca vitripennis]|nr:hypothetical protein J6590_019861 [Homalodisca vitripennis]
MRFITNSLHSSTREYDSRLYESSFMNLAKLNIDIKSTFREENKFLRLKEETDLFILILHPRGPLDCARILSKQSDKKCNDQGGHGASRRAVVAAMGSATPDQANDQRPTRLAPPPGLSAPLCTRRQGYGQSSSLSVISLPDTVQNIKNHMFIFAPLLMAKCTGYNGYRKIKQRRAWLLLGWVNVERSCPCKQPACSAIGGGAEVTFKSLVPSYHGRKLGGGGTGCCRWGIDCGVRVSSWGEKLAGNPGVGQGTSGQLSKFYISMNVELPEYLRKGLINLENPYQLAIKQPAAPAGQTTIDSYFLLDFVTYCQASRGLTSLSLYGDSLKIVQLEIDSPRGICSGAVCVPPHRSAYHYPPSARAVPATVPSSLTVSPYGGFINTRKAYPDRVSSNRLCLVRGYEGYLKMPHPIVLKDLTTAKKYGAESVRQIDGKADVEYFQPLSKRLR